jgi:hypothetical protein
MSPTGKPSGRIGELRLATKAALVLWMALMVGTYVLVTLSTDGALARLLPEIVFQARAIVLPAFNADASVR